MSTLVVAGSTKPNAVLLGVRTDPEPDSAHLFTLNSEQSAAVLQDESNPFQRTEPCSGKDFSTNNTGNVEPDRQQAGRTVGVLFGETGERPLVRQRELCYTSWAHASVVFTKILII